MPPVDDFEDRGAIQAALQQLIDLGGPNFMTEMVELLYTQTPEQFRQIDAGLGNNDLPLAQRQAHSMKSSFGSYGAKECQRIATAMDLCGKQGQRDEFAKHYERLRDAYERLCEVLKELCAANA